MDRLDTRVSPAPYALPPGAHALERPGWAWRRNALLAAVGVAMLCLAFLAGRWSETRCSSAMCHAEGRSLAKGPVARLLTEGRRFLQLAMAHPSDPMLWQGTERLARALLADPHGADPLLMAELEEVLRVNAPPQALELATLLAERRVRGSRTQGD